MKPYLDSVKTRDDLVKLISLLALEVKNKSDGWENNDLPSYLEAMAAWIEDMDGYYENMGLPLPKDVNWGVFADILRAAMVYE